MCNIISCRQQHETCLNCTKLYKKLIFVSGSSRTVVSYVLISFDINNSQLISIIVLLGCSLSEYYFKDTSCRDPWPSTSTLCQYSDSPTASAKGVSEEDIQIILDAHNNYRRAVSPQAKQMQKMVSDFNILGTLHFRSTNLSK